MKYYIFLITLLVGLSLVACGQAENSDNPSEGDAMEDATNDKQQVEDLVKKVLKWHDENGTYVGFKPLYNPSDDLVIGMDLNVLQNELDKFAKTNMFDKEFIENYGAIVKTIDDKIKSKEISFMDGDMPSYVGADPWCNCQDVPYENPWDKIEITFLNVDQENATLTWTWGNSEWSKNFNYEVKAKKIEGTWKISYMQGFEINAFVQ